MTKKGHLILLLSLFLLSCLTAAAKQRSLDEALSIARHHAAKYGLSLDTNAAIHAKALRSRGIAGRKTDCYVFNNAGGKGFTVVSGSDLMPEIVGYARQGSFDADQLPEGLVAFMELYQATADAVEHGDARAIANVNEALRLRQSASRSAAVQPMLGEITWNQGAPFNNMCPIYDGTHRAVTGCVATAMAQVMAYWKHPQQLLADIPAYTRTWMGYDVSVSGIAKGEQYNWKNMLPYYNYDGSNATQEQIDAVAKLMLHCGAAVGMGYGEQSGANLTPTPLAKYFGYDADLMADISRFAYTLDEWTALIDRELQTGRPVFYAGNSSSGGHQFICDGSDGQGLYHINWGWGGYQNGYFDITILNPEIGGIGSGTATDGFNSSCSMIIGVQPDNGIKDEPLVQTTPIVIVYWGPDYYGANTLTITNGTRADESGKFTLTMLDPIFNQSTSEFNGNIAVGVKKTDGTYEPISNILNTKMDGVDENGRAHFLLPKMTIDYAFPVGKTLLYYIYSTDNGQTWHKALYNGMKPYELEATATSLTTAKTSLSAELSADGEVTAGQDNTFSMTLHNGYDYEYNGVVSVYAASTPSKPEAIATSMQVTVPAKSSITRQFTLHPDAAGDFYVWIDEESGESIVSAHRFTATQAGEEPKPALSLVSAATNATPWAFEADKAMFHGGAIISPKVYDDKATFTFGIKNDGDAIDIVWNIAGVNAETYTAVGSRWETTHIAGQGQTTYLTRSYTPESIGTRNILGGLFVSLDGQTTTTLPTELEQQTYFNTEGEKAWIIPQDMQIVYVAGAAADRRTGLTATVAADGQLKEGTEGKLDIHIANGSANRYVGCLRIYVADTAEKPDEAVSSPIWLIDAADYADDNVEVKPEKSGYIYVWIDEVGSGETLVSAQALSVAGENNPGTAISDIADGKPFVRGGKGELLVRTANDTTAVIAAPDGRRVATVTTKAGTVEHVRLDAGIYVVNGTKVAVR